MDNLNKFYELINSQFTYGGQKYAQTKEKEATDVLFDDFGKNWLFGTLAKYVKRYKNIAREKDLLKIACYSFIIWLKRGFHYGEYGTNEIINTTVKAKTEYYPTFQEKTREFIIHYLEQPYANNYLDIIYGQLKIFSEIDFQNINASELYNIFALCFIIWNNDIKNKGTDEDVYNERRKK